MRILILKARSSSSFDSDNLMTLIDSLPGDQKLSLNNLMNFFPSRQIVLTLTDNSFDSTAQRIWSRLNHVFDLTEG